MRWSATGTRAGTASRARCWRRAALVLAVVAASRTAAAWDGRRGGFILGLDIGGGIAHVFHPGAAAGEPSTSTQGGLALSFEIGGAVTDHLRLAFAPELVMYDFERVGTAYKNILKPALFVISWILTPFIPLIGSQALFGAKASYFFQPEAPSAYVAASLGPAIMFAGTTRGFPAARPLFASLRGSTRVR